MSGNALTKSLLIGVSTAALLATAQHALARDDDDDDGDRRAKGSYQSGDLHNHTVCSDGSTSVDTLVTGSLDFLDWFIMSGHSGDGARDCRFDDTTQSGLPSGDPGNDQVLWSETIGTENILGLASDGVTPKGESGSRPEMWRWQALSQFTYPDTVTDADGAGIAGPARKQPAFVGVEWVVPGHEHGSVSVVDEQFPISEGLVAGDLPDPNRSNALKLSQFEYCFARNSDDTSGGFDKDWTCEISAENNQKLVERFADFPEQGAADYNGSLPGYDAASEACSLDLAAEPRQTCVNIDDSSDHVKSVAAIYWLKENAPYTSYAISAHVERQGAFIPGDNEGFNVEHLRDWHTAGWDEGRGINISFGFESQPGHQGQFSRGSYNAGRPSAGLYTFGGTGCYAAAEASKPGMKFDGTPITRADVLEGGELEFLDDRFGDPEQGINWVLQKIVLCRPGVRTMWDAMLSEGRRFFFSGSSDWHNRGSFPYDDFRTTNDFLPGEYQKNYTFLPKRQENPPQEIVKSMTSGNSYVTQGDLVEEFEFRACWRGKCATMGETLTVRRGADVEISMRARDPNGTNHSQYAFPNPILQQIGVEEPINEPSLREVQIITGEVRGRGDDSGFYDPLADPEYFDPMAPQTTKIAATFTADGPRKGKLRGRGEWKRVSWTLEDIDTNMYVRARGSNLPSGTPNARDAYGNPLADNLKDNIACADPACPDHIGGVLNADVETWSDLWVYANPIFIELQSRPNTRRDDDDDE